MKLEAGHFRRLESGIWKLESHAVPDIEFQLPVLRTRSYRAIVSRTYFSNGWRSAVARAARAI